MYGFASVSEDQSSFDEKSGTPNGLSADGLVRKAASRFEEILSQYSLSIVSQVLPIFDVRGLTRPHFSVAVADMGRMVMRNQFFRPQKETSSNIARVKLDPDEKLDSAEGYTQLLASRSETREYQGVQP